MTLRRALKLSALSSAAFVLVVASLLVSPWGQEARRRSARGECPFPHAAGSGLSKLMDQAAPSPKGAPDRPAAAASKTVWNLTLAATRVADVHDWAATRLLTCRSTRKNAQTVECQAIDPRMLAPGWAQAETLTLVFHFDESGLLSGVRALGGFQSDAAAEAALAELASETQHIAGGLPNLATSSKPQMPAAGMLSQQRMTWSRQDLIADLSATRLSNQISIQQHLRLP